MRSLLAFLALFLLSLPCAAQSQSKIGININSGDDWTGQVMFVDIMKHARPWMSCNQDLSNWDSGVADQIAKDSNGYPLSMPQTIAGQSAPQVVHTYISADFPVGQYTVLYDGEPEVGQEALSFRAGSFSVRSIVSRQPGRYVVSVDKVDGAVRVFLGINSSKASNPVRNIRMIMPGYESTYSSQIFYQPFVDKLGPLSTLRFMDTQNTNFNGIVSWSQRAKPTSYTQSEGKGVALEHLIALSNRIGADPWFSIPEAADDDYIRQFARVVNTQLAAPKKVYIEYSNEIWNGGFTANYYCQQRGDAMRTTCPQAFAQSNDPFQSVVVYQARRSAEIFSIFQQEITNMGLSPVKVIGSQAENPGVSDRLFAALKVPCVNPSGIMPDALAVAPYFGHNPPAGTAAQLLDYADNYLRTSTRSGIISSRTRADTNGVKLIAYEGGQHLTSSNGASAAEVAAANRDPRMGTLYDELFRIWFQEANAGTFVAYNYVHSPSQFGAWGLLESQNQDPALSPKYQAVVTRAATTYTNIVDTTPPNAPTNLRATNQTENSLTIAWDHSGADVVKYQVYRGNTQIAQVTAKSHTDTGLTGNTLYAYSVYAVDIDGNRSAPITASLRTLADTTPPTVLKAEALEVQGVFSRVKLSFSESVDITTASFIINNGTPVVRALERDPANFSIVYLSTDPHARGQQYTITIHDVQDLQGNATASNTQVGYSTATRVTSGLVSYYPLNGDSLDKSGVGTPMDLNKQGTVTFAQDAFGHGAVFSGAGMLRAASAEKLRSAIVSSGEFTIEVWANLSPQPANSVGDIITYSAGNAYRNFTLLQDNRSGHELLWTRIRAETSDPTKDDANGVKYSFANSTSTPLQAGLSHIVTVCKAGLARTTITSPNPSNPGSPNVIVAAHPAFPTPNFSVWDTLFTFALGSEPDTNRPWRGTMYLAAIYNRVLTDAEISQNFQVGPEGNAAPVVNTPAPTPTRTPTTVATPQLTATATATVTVTASATATATRTPTTAPSATPIPAPTKTATPTSTATRTPTPLPTSTPTPVATRTATPLPTPPPATPTPMSDTVAPVISLRGTSPVTIKRNSIYNDAGATAFDNVDGDITSRIRVVISYKIWGRTYYVPSVDTSRIREYTITYNVLDAANNAASPVERIVRVVR